MNGVLEESPEATSVEGPSQASSAGGVSTANSTLSRCSTREPRRRVTLAYCTSWDVGTVNNSVIELCLRLGMLSVGRRVEVREWGLAKAQSVVPNGLLTEKKGLMIWILIGTGLTYDTTPIAHRLALSSNCRRPRAWLRCGDNHICCNVGVRHCKASLIHPDRCGLTVTVPFWLVTVRGWVQGSVDEQRRHGYRGESLLSPCERRAVRLTLR